LNSPPFLQKLQAFILATQERHEAMEVLHATARTEVGSNAAKRVRAAGHVPAVLYGHGEANLNLSIPLEEIEAAMRHGSRMVTLQGAVRDTALIRDVQWDPLAIEVLHLDLTRVSASEKVEVSVAVELRGDAPGAREGGMVELVLHEVDIRCPASSIPEKLEIRIHDLHLGDSFKVADIPLPAGAEPVTDPEEVIVHCVGRMEEVVEEVEAAAAGEPEVIGRKEEEEEEES
jgi:large subunit ribosomal protein L25